MKKEKKVRTYQRRTKSGKTITVRAHTASYEAADKAKEAAKKKGAGDEFSSKVKKGEEWKLPMNEFLEKLKEERAKKREDEEPKKVEDEKPKKKSEKTEKKTPAKKRTVGTGTNGPEPKKKTTTKKTAKEDTSEPAFTRDEFKEWYRGTGSAADKKVAKALRKQLGRSGYRKFEDEAIDNYTSRGHLSMFKRVSGGSSTSAKTKSSDATKVTKDKISTPKKEKPEKKSVKGSLGITKSEFKEWYSDTDGSSPSFKKVNKALKKFYGKAWDEVENRAVFGGKTQYQDMIREIGPRFATSPKTSKTSKTTKVASASSKKGFTTVAAQKDLIRKDKDKYNTLKESGWKTKRKNGNYYLISPDGSKMIDVIMQEKRGIGNTTVRTGRVYGRPRKNTLGETKGADSSKKRSVGTGTNGPEPKKPKAVSAPSMKKELAHLLTGVNGSTLRTWKKPAKFLSRKDGTLEASADYSKMGSNLRKAGWKNVDTVSIVGGTSNYVSPDGKYHAIVGSRKTKIKPIKKGEKVSGHSWDSTFGGDDYSASRYD